ncbi:MAG: urocanate hydratase [Bacteroidetes bacterium GWE2_39_28]|nr:MAG: urocanate hydratase [Bacteroidetes bacterium GWE2_39_28]OFY12614.1 MAG: urocanate hydratase [Bacteroidetes bacterium GWF2_39_10]OFZ09368.1 MAG: urocanate hydratase [Bacteroidetes bacterium RIFOXYB2_FULL_39_7]OFZ11609.1 MAG: urocanate hydratase [Bacteroidetes bacterium RIFOXYC2_FULL_39_11]HCT94672.1 urocanate hydratase [Rikenellaceae bacterium]
MSLTEFQKQILRGIPSELPLPKRYDPNINHAPKRKDILNREEKMLALKNALRYFPVKFHEALAPEFASELKLYGRIYMYRFRPDYEIKARIINDYPHKSVQAAAIMLMLSNNLDYAVAQHPHELITYGGNGAVFQNWAQYLLTMQYLAQMTDEQTLVLYSGHPMGLFPSHKDAPRVVVTNGMVIPNYSSKDHWEKFNALGVSQYGQMTAGSFMYIGPQGIVHGTTITVLNAGRMKRQNDNIKGMLFVSSGLGGMSGAQPKAAVIAGVIGVVAEINPKAVETRHSQGWVDEVYTDLNSLTERIKRAKEGCEAVSLAYQGNIVDLWEKLIESDINVELGSDQTSLHNPWAGGYYPAGFSLEESNRMMAEEPERFREEVEKTLRRHAAAINRLSERGMYFFDYGNAFLLEASRAGADVVLPDGRFKYPSYVQDIMGPLFFDYGFGPYRWVCTSSLPKDLEETDRIAAEVLETLMKDSPDEIRSQMADNLHWIKEAGANKLVVGSQARILYADSEGRMKIALEMNQAIREGRISAPIVLGRDHHDVSGTDSPYRETSNIYDGSQFTADMAVHNAIGDSFRGATWVSLHNGGGVGWGEVINGGFGMVIDGSDDADRRIKNMLHWDVNNGISRRAWARNSGALYAIKREMERTPLLNVTIPNLADDNLIGLTTDHIFNGES